MQQIINPAPLEFNNIENQPAGDNMSVGLPIYKIFVRVKIVRREYR